MECIPGLVPLAAGPDAFGRAPPQRRPERSGRSSPRHHRQHPQPHPRRPQHHLQQQRQSCAPRIEDRCVKRSRECPCATRLYFLESNDIATGSAVCSAVLGVPMPNVTLSAVQTTPVSVYMVWLDTTLLEIALEALRARRAHADAAYAAAQQRLQQQREQGERERKAAAAATAGSATDDARWLEDGAPQGHRGTFVYSRHRQPQLSASATNSADSGTAEDEALPHYRVELLCGFVDGAGKTVVLGLGTVELRQVLASRPELVFPVRQGRGSVDYNGVATELGLGYGHPILYTCTRVS